MRTLLITLAVYFLISSTAFAQDHREFINGNSTIGTLTIGVDEEVTLLNSRTFTIDGAVAPQAAEEKLSAKESHAKMIAVLADIKNRTPDESPYHGTFRVRQMRERLTKQGAAMPPRNRMMLHFELGKGELQLGKVSAAIDSFRNSLQILSDLPVASKEVRRRRLLGNLNVRFWLGVAYMRLGETENCCLRATPESCILPIRGGGLHTKPEGSSNAIEQFTWILARTKPSSDMHRQAQWLLNIAYMTIGQHPEHVPTQYLIGSSAFESEIEFPRFPNIAAELGLNSFNLSGGVIIDDFDGDNHLDVFTSTSDPAGQMHFFTNNRDGTFTDRTKDAGLTGLLGGLNLVSADYNNDGTLDVLVLRGAWLDKAGRHPNSLLRNNGDGTFSDVTFAAGLGRVYYPTQTAGWADYDNDGDLDLFIGNETTNQFTAPCQLFRNNGDGTFVDVAAEAGVAHRGFVKGVSWGDYDGDRFADLYVSDYSANNRLYRNKGDGTFIDVAPDLGVVLPKKSFPTWFWDVDNDGVLDLFVSSYTGTAPHVSAYRQGLSTNYERMRLYRGDGEGGFQNITRTVNLDMPILPMGANFGDLDGDGFLDFYLGTGDPDFASLVPNLMFLNQGGKRFIDVTMAGGFGHLQKGHGVAFADIDNDGDNDVFEQMGGAYYGDEFGDVLFKNPGFGNHWIGVRVVGTESNRSGIGARIRVEVSENGKSRVIYRHVNSGGSFGANPLRQNIGLGKAEAIRSLEVFWPRTGKTQTLDNVELDQYIQIVEQ